MKATHGVFGGQSVPIFKDPKTDKGGLKKSQKGCCMVNLQTDGSFVCTDSYDEWVPDQYTCLHPIFCNGTLTNAPTFQEARARLYPEGF